jgi:uncharacterized protein (TIGR00369 family)
MMPKITREELQQSLTGDFPHYRERPFVVEEFDDSGRVVMRMKFSESQLRPGGTIAGPVIFGLCDVTAWAVCHVLHGLDAHDSVTADLTMHFLSRPLPGDLIAVARCVKPGKRLVVSSIEVFPADDLAHAVCHAVATYAMPRR